MVISGPVSVEPSPLVIPYDPSVVHQYRLRASGGSGEYNWYSSDSNIVSVSAHGVVTVHAEGKSTVMAVDHKNQENRNQTTVIAARLARLKLVPRDLEIQVGESIILPVATYGRSEYHNAPFSNCTALPIV